MNGEAREVLRAYRRQPGASWEDVSRQLYADHAIVVSGQTLRRWARELDLNIDSAEAAS